MCGFARVSMNGHTSSKLLIILPQRVERRCEGQNERAARRRLHIRRRT
jgi:hypothetical protein